MRFPSLLYLILLGSSLSVFSQEDPSIQESVSQVTDSSPSAEEVLLEIRIVAKVIVPPSSVAWSTELSQFTVPGSPVRLSMNGSNLRLNTHITPVMKGPMEYTLVAQGQLWLQAGGSEQFSNHFKTLNCQVGDTVIFYPLGRVDEGEVSSPTIALEISLLIAEDEVEDEGAESQEIVNE